jgi:AraC-like DNA-binding protein
MRTIAVEVADTVDDAHDSRLRVPAISRHPSPAYDFTPCEDRGVRVATSVKDVLGDPVGAYFAGQSFMVWFQPNLAGSFAFGRLVAADFPLVHELITTPVLPAGYDMLCDCSAVEVFDERAFTLIAGVLEQRASELLRDVRRFAVVRPAGLAGASVSGVFYDKLQPHVEAALFAHRAEALGWLGYPANAPERAEIDAVIGTFHDVPPFLRDLRALLVTDIAEATLASAAKLLGKSDRSLQRELARANTSFRAEQTRARVRVAEGLLASGDDKIEAIARQLGFASVPAFTALFGRIAGESPVEFRRRRGRG